MARRPQDTTARAPEGSEHGTGAQLQRLADAGPLTPQPGSGAAPEPPPVAPNRVQVERGQPLPTEYATPEDQAAAGDISQHANPNDNLGLDELLFAPTDQPGTPITNGMPFGPGASAVPNPGESPRMFRTRVADEIMRTPGGDDPRIKQFAAAIAQGK